MFWLVVLIAGSLQATEAAACIPNSLEETKKFSDVIVEGTFIVDSKVRGEGHIVAARTLKGTREKMYAVRWNPELLPESLPDCGVEIPESGLFEGLSLREREDGTYQLTGRWQPAKKDR
ncbi:hypothetical protein [Sphingopyxis sp. H115]|uniref:hypothetical protein n=1 Tax=Sphingopyxis sp. H115 TaxID=1759073 RepID=UPI00128EA403|nr:hypothetical protein [Sphingopyxis sp. H115]